MTDTPSFDLGFSLPSSPPDLTALSEANQTLATMHEQVMQPIQESVMSSTQTLNGLHQQIQGSLYQPIYNAQDSLEKRTQNAATNLAMQIGEAYVNAAPLGVQQPNQEQLDQYHPAIATTNTVDIPPYGTFSWTFLVNCSTQQAGALRDIDGNRMSQLLSQGWSVVELDLPPNLLSVAEAEYMIHKHATAFTDLCKGGTS